MASKKNTPNAQEQADKEAAEAQAAQEQADKEAAEAQAAQEQADKEAAEARAAQEQADKEAAEAQAAQEQADKEAAEAKIAAKSTSKFDGINPFQMSRDHLLTSTKGHSLKFTKGVPLHVPYEIEEEVRAAGGTRPDGFVEHTAKRVVPIELTPRDRHLAIRSAIEELIEKNESSSFGANNRPKLAILNDMVGFNVENDERDKFFDEVMQARS